MGLKFLIRQTKLIRLVTNYKNPKVKNGYVRPVAWRGSEMMAISAQRNQIHFAIATWEWGSYFDPKIKRMVSN